MNDSDGPNAAVIASTPPKEIPTEIPAEIPTKVPAQPTTWTDPDSVRRYVLDCRQRGETVAVVPTMGALHEGHLALVDEARRNADRVVVTIFVNPTQFAPTEDLNRYPRPIEQDLRLLAGRAVDAVFMPENETIYPPGFGTYVDPPPVAGPLEGQHRPSHFRGVATVVLKLLQIIPADVAVFGQKDFQQLRVIEDMVRDLNVPTRIIGHGIVRDPDGLAMSSRNAYLTDQQRITALSLSRALRAIASLVASATTDVATLEAVLRDHLRNMDSVDYAVIVDAQTLAPIVRIDRPAVALIAARIGSTRLIDNVVLFPPESDDRRAD